MGQCPDLIKWLVEHFDRQAQQVYELYGLTPEEIKEGATA
jgi:hypothetical protein